MTNPSEPLADTVALVTGAASPIGTAIARRLAGAGADLALSYSRHAAPAEALAAEIAATGRRALAVEMDLTDRASVAAGIAATVAGLGGLGLVVNNAGTSAPGHLLELSSEDWDQVFAVHTRGFFHVGTEAARHMKDHGGGAVIAIAGASALRCYPGNGAYGPSKSAVLAAVRQMAVEWAPFGIRANAVLPGPVRDPESGWREAEPALAAEVDRLPLPRAAAPAEIAQAVLYLATAGYVTGQDLVVDGGGTTTWYIQG
ncbi:SDR family NAD(P)-dependent oxidoreductase [Mangrovicoccus sp. HB161399]|uniref:SDR family NAD(P)-dependent oxidoreductase n=1 Tax=Mangrovicoccus sp. HB161399 TaxID=2720392 RepID=UPI0015521B8E|nr:SDR family oxidoreductase [Mangrovicoccus sp. HB161399]